MNVSETGFSGSSLASQVHAAAVNGHKSTLLKQIAENPDLKDKEDQFGRTPLMYCVLADRLDCAEALLKTGIDVNKADCSQRTALHLAAQKGNYRFMKLLLARRADWLKKDLEEITPLHLTTRHKSTKCLVLLLKYMAPGEIDTQDKNKQTALHWSAYYNNPEHVKLLIKHDSNIGIPDVEGKIPLHWAANHKDPSALHTVRCILDAAPTESLLNWQDYEGRTALHFAVADGNVALVDLLTSYEGCNVTSYDNLFRTPLHWAALLGHTQIVHLLLERNKSGTIPSDSQGATPLHYAAQSNFAPVLWIGRIQRQQLRPRHSRPTEHRGFQAAPVGGGPTTKHLKGFSPKGEKTSKGPAPKPSPPLSKKLSLVTGGTDLLSLSGARRRHPNNVGGILQERLTRAAATPRAFTPQEHPSAPLHSPEAQVEPQGAEPQHGPSTAGPKRPDQWPPGHIWAPREEQVATETPRKSGDGSHRLPMVKWRARNRAPAPTAPHALTIFAGRRGSVPASLHFNEWSMADRLLHFQALHTLNGARLRPTAILAFSNFPQPFNLLVDFPDYCISPPAYLPPDFCPPSPVTYPGSTPGSPDTAAIASHPLLNPSCRLGSATALSGRSPPFLAEFPFVGGGRVDLVDQDGHSPLHWAALGGNPDVCQILIENKINPNVQDYSGRTPLQCAAYGGYINCMVVLLENKADPNVQDKEGRTALHWLCNNGYLDAIKLLLGFGAFPNHMENNEERYTPLDYALLGAHHEVIQFMLERGALSIAAIQDIAAVKIQAVYKGYKVRKAFHDRKNLLMKHEQLRKDAAAKKREEENRRKATELQKAVKGFEVHRIPLPQEDQQRLSGKEVEPQFHVPRSPVRPGGTHKKRPSSSSVFQDRAERSRKDSATILPNKETAQNKCHPTEQLGEDHKRKRELSKANCKSKPACITSHPIKEKDGTKHQVVAKHRTALPAADRDGGKHKEALAKANGASALASKRHNLSGKAASSREKSENQSQSISSSSSHCEETPACVPNSNFTNRSAKNPKQREAALKGDAEPLKAKSKELNAERWSPAGSSRPGSSKSGSGHIRRDPARAALIQTNKSANDAMTRKACCPLPHNNKGAAGFVPNRLSADSVSRDGTKLSKQVLTTSCPAQDPVESLWHKSTNVEHLPVAIRMQVIEKERARKELFRKKNCAAAVIQRSWRSYQLRRRFRRLLSTTHQCKEDEDKWRQETAAFCIEVAWKKQLNRTPLKPLSLGKNLKSMDKSCSAVNSTFKPSTLKQIYGRSQEARVYHPTGPPSSKHKASELQMLSATGLQYVCVLENTGKFKQYSYNLETPSTPLSKQSNARA
ncbi:inversin [Sphaerodactylus townsendi]|uniref:inversin n=1 Tax=Sphaerodactylus townsendi TaxID=933632 RepID=UPI00202699C8|nr:inversin [Sphaerodactylus townsendi]